RKIERIRTHAQRLGMQPGGDACDQSRFLQSAFMIPLQKRSIEMEDFQIVNPVVYRARGRWIGIAPVEVVGQSPQNGLGDLRQNIVRTSKQKHARRDFLETTDIVIRIAAVVNRDVALPRKLAREVVRPLSVDNIPPNRGKKNYRASAFGYSSRHRSQLIEIQRAIQDAHQGLRAAQGSRR